MSGAVKPVANVAKAVYKPMVDIAAIIPRTVAGVASGKKGGALAGVKPLIRDFTSVGEDPISLMGEEKGPDIPDITAPPDLALEADKAKKEKVRVKRQAQIDILTDKPGRGGPILTDDFTYKV
jgi:hypothetical protein